MSLLETLRQEHQEVLELLQRLRESIKLLTEGQSIAGAEGALENFLVSWDKSIDYHFRQEEEALFPVLGEIIGVDSGPISVMLHEHQVLRQAVEHLRLALADDQTTKALEPVRTITSVLSDHITKEDHVLFPMAEELLQEKHLAEMDRRSAAKSRN